MVTSLDLVEEQIKIAEGNSLEKKDYTKEFSGWAIEARVCAEDPQNDFLPTPGPVTYFRVPGGPFTRTDTGIYAGSEITPDYDPMIAKVISWGKNREVAISRLDRALHEFTLKGCTTNTMFLRQILAYEKFKSGVYDTGLISCYEKDAPDWFTKEHKLVALLGAALFNFEKEKRLISQVSVSGNNKSKVLISNWRTSKSIRILPR
jgi:acetyl-CoA carboxylase biotin carboxylase subunit